ncbi:Mitochondrial distribution and morphology protein 10 [Coemansia sp. RSA 1813]|nr:Mitochondrial distribution and morphology protein 10 [Coemansia sp. RSA 1646]KAJ1766832.1 Mitochondrial distribution and morphology protein 10 [Coemansia sp. RSA 1843]KAJ2090461.1 Mitochondrial distribution and morphology protein 10 [Coemansia sp. RSA 986]KAJ2215428.1 Mitochondrial distribution and morphology protein 10 [Coemansia sp. RSA 487]KAJ2570017.1 Mitochondrial distribution and morphology protein 10 [Coemansia sp. RSA 1813]
MVFTTPDYFPALTREFHRETRWDEKNTYSSFCRFSQAILDFQIPYGVSVSTGRGVSSSLNSQLTFSMVPSRASSIGYLASSRPLFVDSTRKTKQSFDSGNDAKLGADKTTAEGSSADAEMLTGFSPSIGTNTSRVVDGAGTLPSFAFARQQQIEDERNFLQCIRAGVWKCRWDASESDTDTTAPGRLDRTGDFLMVAQMYPSLSSITGSCTVRRSPTSEVSVSGISVAGVHPDLQLVVQHTINKRKWSTESIFGTNGKLIGLRGQYNIGDAQALDNAAQTYYRDGGSSSEARRALDEKMNGRFSVGGEAYFGVQESSGGISLGGRYRHDFPLLSELTCVANPLMGHLSLAWAQQLRPRLCAASRYNFNVFSLSSDLAMGLEWQLDDSSIVKARWSDSQGLQLLLDAHLSNMVFSMGVVVGGIGAGATAMGTGKAPLSSSGIRRAVRSFGLQFQWFL